MLGVVAVTCPACERTNNISVPVDNYVSWIDGALIQDALPMLSVDDREQLVTGICAKCWDSMMDEDD